MTTLRTRSAKSAALSHAELDANFKRPAVQKTAAYSCLVGDNRSVIECLHASTAFTITLGDAATMINAETGDYEVTIVNIGAAVVTVARAGSDTINGAATSLTLSQYDSVTLKVVSAGSGYQGSLMEANATGDQTDAEIRTAVESATNSNVFTDADHTKLNSLGRKNAIINGNPLINQREVTGSVVLSDGDYGHDRFKAGASGCSYTFATSANVTTITISAGSLIQVIEGVNLFTGTYTLSWSGTSQGKIGGGSFSDSGVTGSITGGTDTSVEFDSGTISKVQLEAGSVATTFEPRSKGEELALCQRYFQATGNLAFFNVGRFSGGSSGTPLNFLHFENEMRSPPTLSTTGTFSTGTGYQGIPGFSNITSHGCRISGTVSISAGSINYIHGGTILMSAEL